MKHTEVENQGLGRTLVPIYNTYYHCRLSDGRIGACPVGVVAYKSGAWPRPDPYYVVNPDHNFAALTATRLGMTRDYLDGFVEGFDWYATHWPGSVAGPKW